MKTEKTYWVNGPIKIILSGMDYPTEIYYTGPVTIRTLNNKYYASRLSFPFTVSYYPCGEGIGGGYGHTNGILLSHDEYDQIRELVTRMPMDEVI